MHSFFLWSCKGGVSKDEVKLGVISIYASPSEGRSPLNVKFFASVSYSGKYEILWNFGDGSQEKTQFPYTEHTYYTESKTTFVVSATLIVDGSSVATAFAEVTVFPENSTPSISLKKSYIAIPGEKINIKVDGYDIDDDTIKCTVDLYSDGNSDILIKLPGEFQFTPTTPGVFKHTLRCDDGYGGLVQEAVRVYSALRITDTPTSDFDVELSKDKVIMSFVDFMSLKPKLWINGKIKEIKYIGTYNIKIAYDGVKVHFVLDAVGISDYGNLKIDGELKLGDTEFYGCCPDIFVNGDEVMVCFYDNFSRVKCAFSIDSGETFSSVMTWEVPYSPYFERIYPRICGGDGKFFVVWSYVSRFGGSVVEMFPFEKKVLDIINSYSDPSTVELKPFTVFIPDSFTNIEYVSCATDNKNFYLVFSASIVEKKPDIFLLRMPFIEKGKVIVGLESGEVLTLEGSFDFGEAHITNISKSPDKRSVKPEIRIPYITWVEEGNIMLTKIPELPEPQIIHKGEYAIISPDWIIWKQYDGIFILPRFN